MADVASTTAQVTPEPVVATSTETQPDAAAAAPVETTSEASVQTEKKPEAAVEEPQAADTGVPEVYDLKTLDGSPLDAERLAEVSAAAKELGLNQAQAQAYLDRENKAIASYTEQQMAQYKAKVEQWPKDIENDKEIGGAALKENAELAKRLVDRYAPDELKTFLAESGWGNHPGLVKFLVRMGKASAEDKLVVAGPQAGGNKSWEELFYPNTKS